jgi:hypothetical protein
MESHGVVLGFAIARNDNGAAYIQNVSEIWYLFNHKLHEVWFIRILFHALFNDVPIKRRRLYSVEW